MNPLPLPVRRAGRGEPLVLVHGFLGGSSQWIAEIDALGRQFDVIAPDLAGYGAAADRSAPGDIAAHARAVLATLDTLGIERFHLLGHSMGGMVVQEMVHQAPARVLRLVLCATAALGSIPGRFETMQRSRERLAEEGIERMARRTSATWLLERERSPAYPALAALAVCASAQAARAGLDAMEAWDGRDRLAAIPSPTLVVWGEHDRSYGWPLIEALWRTIPGASLAVLPACSHALHLERPALFHALVGEFLQSPLPARAA
ncbi:alpha/beta fold hydrolase [Piscinibacter sakaiensis]|nr:alpha/beta fold hydrolase [Piscinibacter sakaiensis]